MDRAKILSKIAKCLSLSRSSNANEAAIALRQAQSLMREHGIGEDEVLAADVSEESARTPSARRPALWESALAGMVGGAFGVSLFFSPGSPRANGERQATRIGAWKFVGIAPAPEVARYTFEVLVRQLRKARKEYLRVELTRVGRSGRVKRGDLFARAWVTEVSHKVGKFATSVRTQTAINSYMLCHYPSIGEMKVTDRNPNLANKRLNQRAAADVLAGIRAARGVTLNHAVNADPTRSDIGRTLEIEFSGA